LTSAVQTAAKHSMAAKEDQWAESREFIVETPNAAQAAFSQSSAIPSANQHHQSGAS
jgi:hypothetical protein